ncbi:MAG: type I-A CRISPR-associated protein Cas4/Csa1 [Candidatus Helarchaeota archaeon]
MYFLNQIERKILRDKLLPLAREVGVTEDLRGYSWYKSPVKPYYDEVYIPMYLVTGKYCPTSRDVYINKVLNKRGEINYNISAGISVHKTVSMLIQYILEDKVPEYSDWIAKNEKYIYFPGINSTDKSRIKDYMNKIWEYVLTQCKSSYLTRQSEQPYASKRDILTTSIPFLVEHKISGALLGLSGLLSIDCFDYLHNIVFDLKTVKDFNSFEDWYRLAPTGYAMVLESVYEIAIDIGCIVYTTFNNGKLLVKKDIFFINDDLRSWWLEERDKKLEILAQKMDPGTPVECYPDCIYRKECGV